MKLARPMAAAFLLSAAAYVAVAFLLFRMPTSAEAALECGFAPEEFSAVGELSYARTEAFFVSFVRTQDYFTAGTLGLAAAFLAATLILGRRAGAASAGLAAGSGVLAVSAVCVSCIAPALSLVGLGLAGSLLAGVPKWLLFLNMALLTGWGTLFLTRRAAACARPLSPPRPHGQHA